MTQEVELTTIAIFHAPSEAELARSRLSSAGIESFLVGENSSFLYGGNLGGMHLRVRPGDVTDAKLALNIPAEPNAAEQAEASEEARGPHE
jgi:hypothetical protein